jgi:hypothetical protein
MAWSLKGFIKALGKVDVKALEFHVGNGDFTSWAECSLKDPKLSSEIEALKKETGPQLRRDLVAAAKKRFTTLSKNAHEATQLY